MAGLLARSRMANGLPDNIVSDTRVRSSKDCTQQRDCPGFPPGSLFIMLLA